jgi:hypothetical protein
VEAIPFPVKPAFLAAAACSLKSSNPSTCFKSVVCTVPSHALLQKESTVLKMSDNDFPYDENFAAEDAEDDEDDIDEEILDIKELDRDSAIEAMKLLGLPLSKILDFNTDFSLGTAMSIKTASKTLFGIILFDF